MPALRPLRPHTPRPPTRRPLLVAAALATGATFVFGACAGGESPSSEATRETAAGERSAHDAPLLVFAASDLRDALTEVARAHRATGGDSAVLVFGSTGDLATQIRNGAPADLFFAADAEAIDQLVARGDIASNSREVYAVGRLAVVARCTRADTSGDSVTSTADAVRTCPRLQLRDLVSDSLRTIAIADPSHAPYGRAARQAFERAGLWPEIQPKLVLGANISQAELFVSSGNADAGVVALSLLHRDPDRVYTLVDVSLHDPLMQTVAIMARSTHRDAARAMLAFLRDSSGRAIMTRYRFVAPQPVSSHASPSAPAVPHGPRDP